MTRTSKTLRRLGVAGLAVVTIGAGVPALLATAAQAASASTVTIAPPSKSGAAGTCITYTASVADNAGQAPSDTTTVTVNLTDPNGQGTTTTATNSVRFCTVDSTTGAVTTSTGNANGVGQPLNQQQQQFVAAPGQATVTFGVYDSEAEQVAIRAYIDTTNDKIFEAGEPTSTATATFTTGGTTTNSANDAVKTITEVPVKSTDAPVTAGTAQTFRVKLTNAAGDVIANAVPTFKVISGANAAGTTGNTAAPSADCQASDNAGIATCTYTALQVKLSLEPRQTLPTWDGQAG